MLLVASSHRCCGPCDSARSWWFCLHQAPTRLIHWHPCSFCGSAVGLGERSLLVSIAHRAHVSSTAVAKSLNGSWYLLPGFHYMLASHHLLGYSSTAFAAVDCPLGGPYASCLKASHHGGVNQCLLLKYLVAGMPCFWKAQSRRRRTSLAYRTPLELP